MTLFRRASRYGFALFALIALASLQVSGAVSFFGIRPNLALGAAVALLLYFASFGEIVLFSGAAVVVLNWTRGVPWELIAFLGAVCATFVVRRVSHHWHFALETAVLAATAGLLFVLAADPFYLASFPVRFGLELLTTAGSAFFALGLFILWYGAPQENRGV